MDQRAWTAVTISPKGSHAHSRLSSSPSPRTTDTDEFTTGQGTAHLATYPTAKAPSFRSQVRCSTLSSPTNNWSSGKTTITNKLVATLPGAPYNLRVLVFSSDDLHFPHAKQETLSQRHPDNTLVEYRGLGQGCARRVHVPRLGESVASEHRQQKKACDRFHYILVWSG
jgi:hypothetical protein